MDTHCGLLCWRSRCSSCCSAVHAIPGGQPSYAAPAAALCTHRAAPCCEYAGAENEADHHLARCMHGGPHALPAQTIKHKLFMHPPRSVVREEARKMGELDVNLVEKIAPRPVPTSSAEFAARRREFKAEVRGGWPQGTATARASTPISPTFRR